LVVFKDKPIDNIKSSPQNLSIQMVVYKFILKINLILLMSRFTFMPKTGMGIPKTGILTFFSVCSRRNVNHERDRERFLGMWGLKPDQVS